jgi:PKD repeat protein
VRTDEVVEYDASSSYDPDGTIVNYSWDFGDGNTAAGPTVIHSFEEDGEYLVTLKITDNEDLVDGKIAIQIVNNRPPVAAITVSETINVNESVLFDAGSSYDSDGTIVSYTWSFGDGTVASGITATHSFSNNGVYTVTLAIDDNDGAIDQKRLTIFVTETKPDETNKRPVASFTAIPRIVSIDETVYFDASESVDSDGSIVTYLWDFGDGNTATGETTEHTFNEEGTYTITLTVTDNNGLIDIDSHAISATIQATPNQNPIASFIKSTQTTTRGETIHFDATESYDTDGLLTSYSWNFGDGNTATFAKVDHIYDITGTYTITLIVTDNDGLTSQTTSVVTITNASPIAALTISAETIKINETIYFDASESVDSDGSIVTYLWDFGDNSNTATGVIANHTYNEEGTYTITLTVTDNDDDFSSMNAIVTVQSETISSFDTISVIGIAIAALTTLILIAILARRRNN